MANKAQVNFKRGTFDNLKALKAANGILDGTFYLTTDTNRLYIGVGTSEYRLINESINLIEKIDKLPTASEADYGKIYLSISENVLAYCRKKGVNDKGEITYEWVQVNPDTNYITRITEISTPDIATGKTIDIELSVATADYNNSDNTKINGTDKTAKGTIKIPISKIQNEIGNISVGLGVEVPEDSNKSAKVSLTGNGTGDFTLTPGDNISLNVGANNVITISGTDTNSTYKGILTADNSNIDYYVADGNSSAVGDHLKIQSDPNDKIEIKKESNKDYYTFNHKKLDDTTTPTKPTVNDDTPIVLPVIADIKRDDWGHITKFEYIDLAAQSALKNKDYHLVAGMNANKALNSITLADENDTKLNEKSIIDKLDEKIFFTYKRNAETGETKVINGGSLGNLVDKDYVDKRLKNTDCMVYKGTVKRNILNDVVLTDDKNLPTKTDNVKNGDTYLVEADGKFGPSGSEQEAKKGDLFIAIVAKDKEGNITSITWNLIPSGDEIDTQYKLEGITDQAGLQLTNKTTAIADGVINFNTGTVDVIDVIRADKPANNANAIIQVNHKTSNITTTSAPESPNVKIRYGENTTYVAEAGFDNYGHANKIVYKRIKLPEALKLKGDEKNNAVVLKDINPDNNVETAYGTIKFVADTKSGLTVKPEVAVDADKKNETTTFTFGFEWGEF